jgi:signal transduction histidine kinase
VKSRAVCASFVLQRVSVTIIGHAAKAESRLLKLATSLEGAAVRLSVQDSGPRICRGVPDRIFDPFFTTKPSGMGLGLAICRTIIENHGGKLRLAKSQSGGSIFEISMPIGT